MPEAAASVADDEVRIEGRAVEPQGTAVAERVGLRFDAVLDHDQRLSACDLDRAFLRCCQIHR